MFAHINFRRIKGLIMKKMLAAAAAVSLMAVQAQAADLAVRPLVQEPAYVAPFTWTGMYSGFHAGYGWGHTRADFLGVAITPTPDPKGWFAGTSIGYNWQMSSIVLGVEADFSYGKIKDSVTVFAVPGVSVGGTTNMDYFFTVRGRLGFAVDRALFYGTGGVAWAHNNATVDITVGPLATRIFDDRNHTGWTVGGGIEYAITNSWSAKAEYLYMDLGSKNYTFVQGLPPVSIGLRTHTAKIGLNYKFSIFGL
jgi:outer membrane immunogenic protein